jgi:hypothetical protein
MNRTVTEVEKKMLKQRLVGLKLQLSGDSQTHVLQPELIHGLTDEVITDIVVKSEIHFTPDDVMTNCQIWSYETGVAICNTITTFTVLFTYIAAIMYRCYFKCVNKVRVT